MVRAGPDFITRPEKERERHKFKKANRELLCAGWLVGSLRCVGCVDSFYVGLEFTFDFDS